MCVQVPGNGVSAPAQLLWAAPNPGQGSWQPLDLALVPAPQAPLPAAAVLAADDRGQVGLLAGFPACKDSAAADLAADDRGQVGCSCRVARIHGAVLGSSTAASKF